MLPSAAGGEGAPTSRSYRVRNPSAYMRKGRIAWAQAERTPDTLDCKFVVDETAACFIVRDENGQALAYVYSKKSGIWKAHLAISLVAP
jgi:hypothetical protein